MKITQKMIDLVAIKIMGWNVFGDVFYQPTIISVSRTPVCTVEDYRPHEKREQAFGLVGALEGGPWRWNLSNIHLIFEFRMKKDSGVTSMIFNGLGETIEEAIFRSFLKRAEGMK